MRGWWRAEDDPEDVLTQAGTTSRSLHTPRRRGPPRATLLWLLGPWDSSCVVENKSADSSLFTWL